MEKMELFMDRVQEERDGGVVSGARTTGGQNAGERAYVKGYSQGTGGTQSEGGTTITYKNGAIISQTIEGNFGLGGNERQAGGGGGYYGGAGSTHGAAGRRFIIY